MGEQATNRQPSIGKILTLTVMTGLLIWQGVLAYFVSEVSDLFVNLETPGNMIVFVVWTQPFIWLFMLLTVLAIYDIFRRNKFLVINTLTLISIIAVANIFLQILVLLVGYAPLFELGNAANS